MAVQLDGAKLQVFEDIFTKPSIDEMVGLSPSDFEHFVGHVFTCAGYAVEHVGLQHYPDGPGVDFNLYVGKQDGHYIGSPIARIEVRRYKPSNWLGVDAVMSLIGRLHLVGDVPGFLVTTSDFYQPARIAAANSHGLVKLINGEHLLRYIAYVGGSRFKHKDGVLRTPVRVAPDCLLEADAIPRRDGRTSRVLAIANNKGGVGKTTATLNLGFALSQQGQKVLLVDMDGQSSLTLAVPPPAIGKEPKGAAPVPHSRFLSEFFAGRTDSLAELVQRTRFDHLYILPGNADLHRMDSGGGAHPDEELRFVRALHDSSVAVPSEALESGPFDWILIDTPPAQTFYTRAAIAASHYTLIPIEVEAFAAKGIERVLQTIHSMKALVGTGANTLGAIITCWRSIPNAQKDKWTNLQADLAAAGVYLFNYAVPYDDSIDQAHLSTIRGSQRSIFGFGGQPKKSAVAYINLLKRIKERVEDANNSGN